MSDSQGKADLVCALLPFPVRRPGKQNFSISNHPRLPFRVSPLASLRGNLAIVDVDGLR
jgi:hypothetical protein